MRELTQIEIDSVTGALNVNVTGYYVDMHAYYHIRRDAFKDGLLFAAIPCILLTAAGNGHAGLKGAAITGLVSSIAVAPFLFMWGYFSSSAWKRLPPAE